jgi:diguanylate cyclase (GGDEF)-like protein/PAS domain S-box-containing protein
MTGRPELRGLNDADEPDAVAGAPISAESYQRLLERVPAIIYIADAGETGRWHYVSPQIESILGFTAKEWCANAGLWAQQLHPDDRSRVLHGEAVAAGEVPRPNLHDGTPKAVAAEYRLLHRNGHEVWLSDDAILVREPSGTNQWHGVLSDITERKRADAELERRAAQQSAVARFGEHALEGATTAELMHEAVAVAAESLGVEISGVFEFLEDEDQLVLRSSIGIPEQTGGRRVPAGSGSQSGYTIVSGAPVVVKDWQTEQRFAQPALSLELGARSGVSVAIVSRRGPFGVLIVQSSKPRAYARGDVDFLQALANVLADALERQATEDRMRHRALHDALTGLPNRVLFLDRLDQALSRQRRSKSAAAVLFLDLDHFKLVNDSLGHQVGDELLAAAAPRIKQAVRMSDTVARFGGDEFGILLEDVSGDREAVETAQRIAAVFTRPFVLAGREHFVTTSIGIVVARGGELADELIRDADAAMYRAKEHGRARYELFDEVMRGRAIARLRVENDLRRALERGELRLDYQPVVTLHGHRIVQVEALLRWDHPERGVVSPGDFIPVAEENGMIEPIGRWVLEQACRQAAHWQRSRPDEPPISVSVNLSTIQVAKRGVADAVAEVLAGAHLPAHCLSLEITESAMLRDVATLADALHALAALGLRIVLDDFGTGSSSLGYLTHLPLDAIKVDRSFVDGLGRDRRDTAITQAIVAMAQALSLQVVGEGVETEEQAQALSALGCQLAQGFLFAPPVAPAEIERMLDAGSGWLKARRARIH